MAKELERTYKNLVNQAINEQLKNIKVIPQQHRQIQTQNNNEMQQNGKIMENYQKLIKETKIDQQNIKRRYSIKMMTDQNFYSDTEIIDTVRKEQSETQTLKTN